MKIQDLIKRLADFAEIAPEAEVFIGGRLEATSESESGLPRLKVEKVYGLQIDQVNVLLLSEGIDL